MKQSKLIAFLCLSAFFPWSAPAELAASDTNPTATAKIKPGTAIFEQMDIMFPKLPMGQIDEASDPGYAMAGEMKTQKGQPADAAQPIYDESNPSAIPADTTLPASEEIGNGS